MLKRAVVDEVKSHLEHGTWEIVPRSEDENVICTKTVLKVKTDQNGEINRRKARVVARGFEQRSDFDYNETYAPVARFESIRLMMAIAAEIGTKVQQRNVKTAYLKSDLNEEL